MRHPSILIFVVGVLTTVASMGQTAPTLLLYGNFQTMGVIATLEAGDDPDGDVIATVEYRSGGRHFCRWF